ncbi:MAG: polyprenol phosphomannose-dependent alpha 1,6 mannosyltransferase MptB [Propionibacteriaceae bacterium]|nr:polyprenol phosphomannose-dependent alpha 1,6 mannosyltransferase MptB [Propionibacteriaceae bacterium]
MSWAVPLYRRLSGSANDLQRRATIALVEAYAVTWVRRGMIGCLLMAIGGLSPAFLPANSPWWQVLGAFRDYSWLGPTLGTVAALAGVLLVMDAWFRIRPVDGAPEVDFRAVLALWSLPMLLAPPIFSHDSYAYAAEGYMVHEGLNPYEMGAGMLQNRWGEQVVEVWRFTRAPYGPLSLQLSHLVVDVFGHSPYWSSAVGMRILAIAGIIATAYTIPILAERLRVSPRRAMWFGLVNPLAIAHLVGGAHNDAVMIGFISLGLLAAIRRRFLLGCVLVAAAAAVKIPAVLAIVPVAVLAWGVRRPRPTWFGRLWQTGWRVFVATLVMVLAFTIITLACLPNGEGWGWIRAINVPGMVSTISPPTLIGDLARIILNELGYHREALSMVRLSRQIAMVTMVIVILVMLVRMAPTRPMRFLVYSWMALIIGSPALHPWYLTWPAVFLAFSRPSPRIVRVSCWASIGLLTYSSVSFSWRNDLTAVGVAAAAVVIWVILAHDRQHFRHFPQPRSERAEVADQDPGAIQERPAEGAERTGA